MSSNSGDGLGSNLYWAIYQDLLFIIQIVEFISIQPHFYFI